MFRRLSLICATALCCTTGLVRAQAPCMTDEMYREAVKQYPQILEYEKQFNAQAQALKNGGIPAGMKPTLSPSDTTWFDMPIVVHIVHDYGNEYLADNVIYEAVKYWSKVFTLENTSDTSAVIPPFKQYVGNPRIRIHLATIDPNGKPTKGVVHTHSYLTTNADDQAKIGQWPQNKYMNFWFINTFGASASGAAAYAYLPAMAQFRPYYDGVIGLYDYINYYMAIPHEIGHELNLQHVWGNNNNPDVACGDDQVDDTPPTKGHMPSGCSPAALYDTVCATGYLEHYTDISGGDSIANYPDTTNAQNIMDYTYCQKMFTIGQSSRMRDALTSTTAGRNNLMSASNLLSTGALAPVPDLLPVADFSVERGSGSATDKHTAFLALGAGSFNFRNRSWNDTVDAVDWQFSNGALFPTSTNINGASNTFAQPGWVTISLAAHANSGSDTITNDHAVYVADTVTTPGLGFYHSFWDENSISNWPMYNYFENQYKWSFFSGASADGDNGCIRYRSFDTTNKRVATPLGDYDDFFTQAFDLSQPVTGNTYLNFKAAAASGPNSMGAVGDSLEIDVSNNGGVNWIKIYGAKRGTLVNNGTKSTEFIPNATTTWTSRGVQIPAANQKRQTYFRFRYWPGSKGNNFYMDDVRIEGFPAEVADLMHTEGALKIVPNPAANGCNIVFHSGNSGTAAIQVKDITGRVIYTGSNNYAPNTTVQEPIGRDITPIAGIYFVSVTVDGTTSTDKLVVY